jgi:ATP-dependent protease HslVU (ClpYQ) peptidase subunit
MSENAVVIIPEQRPANVAPPVPMDLVQRAFDAGNLDLVQRAMELQERWEKNQARKAFEAAMAAVRGKLPIIIKNRKVDFTSAKGRTNYDYEDLAGIASQIDGILADNGLSYRFRTIVEGKTLTVTCVISHRDGYYEENSLSGPHDVSGNKNDIQAVGSSQTYLQRYTLKAALGLAAGKDTDAQPIARAGNGSGELLNAEQIQEIEQALAFKDMPVERFLKWARLAYRGSPIEINAIGDIPAHCFKQCLTKIENAGAAQ